VCVWKAPEGDTLPQKPSEDPWLSQIEKAELLNNITRGADAVRLRKFARHLVGQYDLKSTHTYEDLLQEAGRQFLSHDRQRGLNVIKFLMGAMKGKANSWFRQKVGRKEEPESETRDYVHQDTEYDDLARERYLEIRRSVDRDAIAQRVLDGIVMGHKVEHLLNYVLEEFPEVDETVLASKRKKLLRHIEGLGS
jgi:hypothetical protein